MSSSLLVANNLSYAYTHEKVLDGVNLELFPGELHLLVGENGAGKSTLAKILHGFFEPSAGSFNKIESLYLPQHVVTYRETTLAEYLWLYYSFQNPECRSWNTPSQRVSILQTALESALQTSVADQTLKQSLSAISSNTLQLWSASLLLIRRDCPLVILDEPGAVLTSAENERMFGLIKRSTAEGVAVLLITHRIHESVRYSQRFSILRRGNLVQSGEIDNFPAREQLHNLMFTGSDSGVTQALPAKPGEPLSLNQSARPQVQSMNSGESGLPAMDFTCKHARFPDLLPLRDVHFQIQPGEILGICGIRDEGMEQLERLLSGRSRDHRVDVKIFGEEMEAGNVEALRNAGVGIVPSDRKRFGAAQGLSAWENIGVYFRHLLSRSHPVKQAALISSSGRKISAFERRIKHTFSQIDLDLDRRISEYSGGMLQRLIIHREQLQADKLLILCSPGWGLDPLQREGIYKEIREKAQSGTAVLLLSPEIDETRALSHRIAVLYKGELIDMSSPAASRPEVLEAVFLNGRAGLQDA